MKKLKHSLLPTPCYKLENLSKLFSANIYCKRDDLTGFAFGGNKTRKLDYLIADALNKKADTLIAIGGIQSNFCRIASAMGKANGLEVHLVLGGSKEPKKYTANLLLDKLFGANINFIESENWSNWENFAKKLEIKLMNSGKRTYWMPIGGSNSIGARGYVDAMNEIVKDEKKLKIKFNYICHATASAGTQSGLIIGAIKEKWNGNIIGFDVSKPKEQLEKEVLELSKKLAKSYKLKNKRIKILIDSNYMGSKYAEVTDGGREAVEIFVKTEGIMLDYVYSGKAAAGLIDYLRKGKFKRNSNILFLHTGGNIHLFK